MCVCVCVCVCVLGIHQKFTCFGTMASATLKLMEARLRKKLFFQLTFFSVPNSFSVTFMKQWTERECLMYAALCQQKLLIGAVFTWEVRRVVSDGLLLDDSAVLNRPG